MICDNAYFNHKSELEVPPQCYDNTATKAITIEYSEVESDILSLCDECAKAVAKDARRHGYKVTSGELKKKARRRHATENM